MKACRNLIALIIIGTLTACAHMNPHPMDMTQAVQNATTKVDHENLAKHYEDTAKQMQAKALEHKKMLEKYQDNAAAYGRQAADLESHCRNLISSYEEAERANLNLAEIHRKMALEAK